jgi:dTDP-4-amino-4,6-dideoxygalactose transaminase
VKPGDDVIVPANSFFATAEAVSNMGARPVFADVDERTFHISVESAARLITRKTRAIIPVHLYGRAVDMTPIEELAASHNLVIIEDAAQAHGAAFAGSRVGASGRLTCFSMYPGKNLGAYGDGGAITTSDPEQLNRLRMLRDHGSPAKYQHAIVGRNSRLDAIQAAVLSVKLKHLDQWNALRWQHAMQYNRLLAGAGVITPDIPAEGSHIFHLYVIRSSARDELRNALTDRAIGCGIHYPVPIHLTQAYQTLGAPKQGALPVTERLAGEVLSLPMFPELTDEQIQQTSDTVLEFAKRANATSQ